MELLNRTIKRSKYKHLTERERYKLEGCLESKSPAKDIAPKLKWLRSDLNHFMISTILKDKRSLDAVIGEIKRKGLEFKGLICAKTLYNYLDRGVLSGISNTDLWEKRKRKKKKYKRIQRVCLKNKGCRSIEERLWFG